MPPFNQFKIAVSALLSRSSEQRREVRIDVAVVIEPTSSGQKDVVVRLTREDDAQFLYAARISEDNYGSLRKEQGLGQHWHEFSNFPAMFSGLIEKCASTPEKSDQPKRWMQLTELPKELNGQSSLKMEILQTTEVKPVILLALSFVAATDAQIKDYLTSKLTNLKQKLSLLDKDKKLQLTAAKETIEHLNEKLKTQEVDSNERISALQKEKETALTKVGELERERELLEREVNEKCSECDDLQYEKEQYLKEIDELKSCLLAEKELNRRLQEELDVERSKEEESAARLGDELDGLKVELRKKNLLCINQQREISRLIQLEKDLKHDLKLQEGETQKGVEIIQKMMRRERAAKSEKIRAENDQVSLRDEKLKSMEGEYEAVKADLALVRADLEKLQSENKQLIEKCTVLSTEKEDLSASLRAKNKALADLYHSSRQATALAISPLGPYPIAVHNVSPSYRPVLGLHNPTAATSPPTMLLHHDPVSPISLRGTSTTPSGPIIRPPNRPNV
uniref:Spindle assembly abnormal protein 6 N-terminal domain-containing protein n=1 Tax=Plectus sambesii TaxID=2011161 RepID=A0A914WX07_9BILA